MTAAAGIEPAHAGSKGQRTPTVRHRCEIWSRREESNLHDRSGQQFLRLPRLPVSPRRDGGEGRTRTSVDRWADSSTDCRNCRSATPPRILVWTEGVEPSRFPTSASGSRVCHSATSRWCARPDLNRDDRSQRCLRPPRLPIPPRARGALRRSRTCTTRRPAVLKTAASPGSASSARLSKMAEATGVEPATVSPATVFGTARHRCPHLRKMSTPERTICAAPAV